MHSQRSRFRPRKADWRNIQEFSAGSEKHRVYLTLYLTAGGAVAILDGGEKPHIGAVAIAVSRPSLKDRTVRSTTSSVFTLVGHKDDEIARPMAERLAKALNRTTIVTCGVHVDHATEQDIELLKSNSMACVDTAIDHLGPSS
jgi:hypothetical protein